MAIVIRFWFIRKASGGSSWKPVDMLAQMPIMPIEEITSRFLLAVAESAVELVKSRTRSKPSPFV